MNDFDMEQYRPTLEWIDQQRHSMVELVIRWAKINSHTFNLDGQQRLIQEIRTAFQPIGESVKLCDLSPLEEIDECGEIQHKTISPALIVQTRPSARHQVLLVCHMDTVYPAASGRSDTVQIESDILKGPGTADAKGGIVVMLKALEALEQSPCRNNVGWQVLINADEEIGSPSSRGLLQQMSQKAQIGLVYEPCLPTGDLIGMRKGSGNFTVVVRGVAAHAGRNPQSGKNAINILTKCILKINSLHEAHPGMTINVGAVRGGGAVNVVPDLAIARFNVRIEQEEDADYVSERLNQIVDEFSQCEGISVKAHGGFNALPKCLNEATLDLYKNIQRCATQFGLNINWHASGGVCDGNRLSAFGLPNIDTMGVRGGDIHSPKEYMYVDSLTERAKLSALFLMQLGAGDFCGE